MGLYVNTMPCSLYPDRDPVPILQEANMAQGPIWTDVENYVPTMIRFLDNLAHGKLLY